MASQVQVLPAWRASRRDGTTPVRDGWQVIVDGEWAQTFPRKSEAEAAAKRIEAG